LKQRSAAARSAADGQLDAAERPVEFPEPLRVPGVLQSIPWEVVQRELGVLTTDLVAMVALVLWGVMKDPKRGERPLPKGTYSSSWAREQKDE
jgi:hypothetical protein